MKIQNKLIEEIKTCKGTLLGIGISNDKILAAIKQNHKIVHCDMLDNLNNKETKGSSKEKGKTVSIYRLRKKYGKEKINIILCNVDDIKQYLKYFMRDGFHICKDKLYVFGKKDILDIEELKKRLQRYKMNMKYVEDDTEYMILIDKQKGISFADYFYFCLDTIMEWLDKASDILGQ